MKKIILGALVGALIFFVFESAMWMGGLHTDFSMYTPNQKAIMETLNSQLTQDGAYMMPTNDWNSPNYKPEDEEKLMQESAGKPWALVMYHTKMMGMEPSYMLKGFLYILLASLMVCWVLRSGSYTSFGKRFAVAMAFSLFGLLMCTLTEMNWWNFPWHFIKATVFDMTVGWALTSLWFAYYVKDSQ